MREARSYVGGEFMPASAREFAQIVSEGGKRTGLRFAGLRILGYGRRIRAPWSPSMPGWSTTRARKCTFNMQKFARISRNFD